MIFTRPFSLSTAPQERVFYVLDALPRFASEVGVWVKTPNGLEPIDFIDVEYLPDGTLVASWGDAFGTLPLHNVVVQTGDDTQIVNLAPIERVIDCYDRPTDSTFGTFSFTDSIPIDGNDWRCHRGLYAAWQFTDDQHGEVLNELSEILVYETLLSINGTMHLIYVEATNKDRIAFQKINNSIAPASGRTLQEVLRLIYEWFVVSQKPFNCTDKIALAARDFIRQYRFSDLELEQLAALNPMQVAQYLSGDEAARVRPDNISPMSGAISRMVFKRMSSFSFSALMRLHGLDFDDPQFNFASVLKEDQRRLHVATQKFRDKYGVGLEVPIVDTKKVVEKAVENHPAYRFFIEQQVRTLVNRREVLGRVADGNLF